MSYRDEVREQIEGLGQGMSGHVRVNCPACPDRVGKVDFKHSLSVNMRNGWWKCHRCEYRGRLNGYDEEDYDGDGWEDVEEVEPTFEEVSDFHELPGRALALQRARDYLERRGVPPHVQTEAGLGYALRGKHAGRIIMPIVNIEGDWIGWVGRGIDRGVFPPYYTSPGFDRRRCFLNDRIVDEARIEPLIVTEGPFDALRWWPNAVACLGKPTEDHIERLKRVERPIIIALDGDAWQEGVSIASVLRICGREAYALALPRGEDLDSTDPGLVREGIAFALSEHTDADLRGDA